MPRRVLLLVGTRKGAFILDSDESRRDWRLRGPFCENWPINHVNYDPATGTIYAGGGNEWFGPAVWQTHDLGETWTHSSAGITYGDAGPKIRMIWNVTPAHGALYAGADPAGLFRSDDGGQTWTHVAGLREHPTCPEWMPGNGGLCLHTIVPHPENPNELWVGMSAVGVFHTADGGKTWTTRNKGTRQEFGPERYPEWGQCVHKMVIAAGRSELLYQQNHCGVYRSGDGGQNWTEISAGLPSDFGFPMVAHPHDPKSVYVMPLSADFGRYMPGGAVAVWSSRSGGERWERLSQGLPQQNAYLTVLREAMGYDTLDEHGLYFGSNCGHLFASADEGRHWQEVAHYLPPILSVEAAVVD